MRTDYAIIILGNSCFALGYALKHPENTLIIESGEGFGPEFVDALRACSPIQRPESEAAALYDELIERGIMDQESAERGELHMPAVNIVLNRIALEGGVNIRFRTRLIEAVKTDDGVRLTTVCCARMATLTCRMLIDTRSTDYSRIRSLDSSAAFALSANMLVPDGCGEEVNGLRFVKGFLPEEAWIQLPLDDLPSPHDREKLMSAFENRNESAMPMRLLVVAHAWSVECRSIREKTDTGWYIPGCGFGNPVEAFEAGMKEAFAW